MKAVRIKSPDDGMVHPGRSVTITDETGATLAGVVRAEVLIEPDDFMRVNLTQWSEQMPVTGLDVTGAAAFYVNSPDGHFGKVARIEFEGGHVWTADA